MPSRRLAGALLLAAFGGCAPKGGTVDASKSTPAPTSTATPDTSEARLLVGRAFGAGLVSWDDPAVKPGERLVWRIRATGAPDVVIEVRRSQPDRWSLMSEGKELPLDGATPATTFDEARFTAAGGSFLGNEVVRVPAGDFRARHGLLTTSDGALHVYVVRSVPGGLVKLERFLPGGLDPIAVLELEDFVKLKKEPTPP